MNKFVFSALAATVVSATGFANDNTWTELDRELAALNSAPLTQDQSGPFVSGWLIGAISTDDRDTSGNGQPGDADGNEITATGLHASRVNIKGDVGAGYGFVLGFDFTDTGELYAPGGTAVGASGTAGLTDAYAHFGVGEQIDIKLGVFRRTFLRSSNVQRNHTLFVGRSRLGAANSFRDAGAAVSGAFDRLHWEVALTNGLDGATDGWAYSGHVDFDVLGTTSNSEGSYGAAEGTNLNIGVTYADDNSKAAGNVNLDNAQMAVDATLTSGGFTAFAEAIDQDKDVVLAAPTGATGNTPYSAGLAYLFGGGNYEVALRYDDWDDAMKTTRYTFGVNRYIQGHDIKWQLNFGSGSDDTTNGTNENDVITLGLAVGF